MVSAAPLLAAILAAAPSPAERLAAIRREVATAEAEMKTAVAAAKGKADDPAVAAAVKRFTAAQAAGLAAAVELARADPASDTGFSAVEWVLTTPPAYYQPAGKAALELAAAHHAADPRVGKSVAWVGYHPPAEGAAAHPAALALFRAVAEKNPDRAARGQAYLALAWQAQQKYVDAEQGGGPDQDRLAAAAEQAFEVVVKEYADCPRLMRPGQRSLGEEAAQELFELRHLRVGKVAPELAGDDLDGRPVKLSTHARGKVTVVIFWAAWCPACGRMGPAERELAARMTDKPVAVLGVNGDGDRERARQAAAAGKMTWPSLWNGRQGADGPLTRAWNVRLWPTVYVLDAKGVIRFKSTGPDGLVKTVDRLVGESGKPE